MILLFAPLNNQGIIANFILESYYKEQGEKVQWVTTNSIDFTVAMPTANNPEQPISHIYIIGIPYYGATISHAWSYFKDKVTFISGWGQSFPEAKVSHVVDPGSPCTDLYRLLSIKETRGSELAEALYTYVEPLEEYHVAYNVEEGPYPLILNDLLTFFGKRFMEFVKDPHVPLGFKPLQGLCEDHSFLLGTLKENRHNYISRVLKGLKTASIGSMMIGLVYADQYQNEVAHVMLTGASRVSDRAICLVGGHTKSRDIFRIRTQGVNASEVARALGARGGGKESVGSVFIEGPTDSLFNVILGAISSADLT